MVFCKCCRCSKSIESLDLQKPPTEIINKREKLSQAQAKSYKKLRLSSFIPESFVNSQQLNNQMNTASTSNQVDALCLNEQTNVKKYQINQAIPSTSSHETRPKIAFTPIQQSIYEEEGANEAETLIGPNNRTIIDKNIKMNSNRKKDKNINKLEISNDDNIYNFDYNLYSIKKNISVWFIDLSLITSNGQTLKNILNKGYHHLNYFFDPKPNDDLILSDDISTTLSTTFNNTFSNSTSLLTEDEALRKKLNDLWSFYLFMFNLGLVISSIALQLLVGILLLLNTKSSKKKPNYPKGNAECYNHLILIIILLITVINVFIVIFVDEEI